MTEEYREPDNASHAIVRELAQQSAHHPVSIPYHGTGQTLHGILHHKDMMLTKLHECLRRPDKATVLMRNQYDFIEYFKRFSDARSVIFADRDKHEILAELDYIDPRKVNEPTREHKVTLQLKPSTTRNAWTNMSNRSLTQTEFAEFLEEHAEDITQPDAATILEVAKTLIATTEVDFKQSKRLQDGQVQLRYEETINARAGAQGELEIPEYITVGIPFFEDSAQTSVRFALRYRIKEGQLVFILRPIRMKDSIDQAFAQVVQELRDELDNPVYMGEAHA